MTTFYKRRRPKYPLPARPAAWDYAAVVALGLAFAYLAAAFI